VQMEPLVILVCSELVSRTLLGVTNGSAEFDSATRTATPEEEQEAVHQLGHLFEVIDLWQATDQQQDRLSAAQTGSPLAGDDQATNPYQVSHTVIHELAGALDHLHALRMLVQTAQSLQTFAPFTLNRAAMECGAAAVWVLAPKSRDERIRRRLALATRNAKDIDSALIQLGEPSSLKSRLDDIRKVAARRPVLDATGVVGTPPSIERIIREAADTFALHSDEAVMMWKLCSGITHNRLWASLNLLDRKELGRVANVRDVHVSASFRNVLAATTVSVWFSTEARRLFALRASA
jgi:hypothetical protein